MKAATGRSVVLIVAGLVVLSGGPAWGGSREDQRWAKHYESGVAAIKAKDFQTAQRELLGAFELADEMDASDPRHARTLKAMTELWKRQRQWAAADPYLEKLVVLARQVHGEDHVEVSYALSDLADNYVMMERYDKAEAAYTDAITLRTKHKGEADPSVARLWHNLGEAYRRWGRLDRAEALYREVLARKEAAHGKDHGALATSLVDLALVMNQQKKFEEAQPLLERATKLAASDPHVLGRAQHHLGDALAGLKRYKEAEPLYLAAIRAAQEEKPVDLPGLGESQNALGNLYQRMDRDEDAILAYQKALEARREEYGSKHARTKLAAKNLALLLDRMGRVAEAIDVRTKYALE